MRTKWVFIEDPQDWRHRTVCFVFLLSGHMGPGRGWGLTVCWPRSHCLCFFILQGTGGFIHSGQVGFPFLSSHVCRYLPGVVVFVFVFIIVFTSCKSPRSIRNRDLEILQIILNMFWATYKWIAFKMFAWLLVTCLISNLVPWELGYFF